MLGRKAVAMTVYTNVAAGVAGRAVYQRTSCAVTLCTIIMDRVGGSCRNAGRCSCGRIMTCCTIGGLIYAGTMVYRYMNTVEGGVTIYTVVSRSGAYCAAGQCAGRGMTY